MILSREKMWDMPIEKSGGQAKPLSHWGGNLLWIAVGGIFKLAFRLSVKNKKKLTAFKGVTGVVVICNHTSFLDVACIYISGRPSQWIRIMGRDSLFDAAHGLGGQILSRTGAFPVKRDTADRSAIKRAAKHLKNGENVGILPEGTRRGKGNIEPRLHAGAAFIAKMGGNVPIVPMTVRGVENVKRKGERVRFPKVTVEYGDPILLADFDDMPKEERLEGCTWYAMRECFALFENKCAQDVDMVSLFPDDKDYTDYFASHPVPHHSTDEVVAMYKLLQSDKSSPSQDNL